MAILGPVDLVRMVGRLGGRAGGAEDGPLDRPQPLADHTASWIG